MSEAPDRDERTEQPSEKRLREARERGEVPRSRELGNVAVLG
ncbi:MAG TPA: EscU/YscU/HrcU family type III secretion system export apparatus switch protein, partial [Luteimonas sp.]